MALSSGRYTLGPQDGELLVKTRREGAASMVGHDLTLRADRWRATVVVDVRSPGGSSVTATVDARSLVVVEATGGAIGITDSQRLEIERITRDSVLQVDRHPTIAFRSVAVSGDPRRASVSGTLTIRGTAGAVTLEVRINQRPATPRIRATAFVEQTAFGIKPYSTFLGALRVRDLVEVVVEVRLPQPRAS